MERTQLFLILLFIIVSSLLSACDSEKAAPPSQQSAKSEIVPIKTEADISLVASCSRCHGNDGVTSKPDTPFIAGQSAEYLELSMRAYLAEQRKHEKMRQAVLDLDVTQRQELANYYAKLKTPWKGGEKSLLISKGKQPVAVTKKNIEAGKALSGPCRGCHGVDGNSIKAEVPSLAGLQPAYFVPALKYYLSGVRRGAAIMKNFKLALDDEDINNLAAYYSVQQRIKSPLTDKLLKTTPSKALVPKCEGCHGVNGNSTHPAMPSLSGQNASYLIKAMQTYRDGQRPNDVMVAVAKGLSYADIAQNATYFATQTPEKIHSTIHQSVSKSFDPMGEGEKLAASCNACHGQGGNNPVAGAPRLAGLSDVYLQMSIGDYRDGKRKHEQMQMLTEYLSDTDIEKISYYYASQQPVKANTTLANANADEGLRISGPCANCHHKTGNSEKPKIPSIAGQSADYLFESLKAYRENGSRNNSDMLNAVKDLGDAALRNLALYNAQLTPKGSTPRELESPEQLAKKCDRCHGDEGKEPNPEKPRIAGQRQSYLVSTMLAYQNGDRTHSMMQKMSKELWLIEIEAIATYYASK